MRDMFGQLKLRSSTRNRISLICSTLKNNENPMRTYLSWNLFGKLDESKAGMPKLPSQTTPI